MEVESMKQGRFWPTEADSVPRSTRFWVPANNPDTVAPIVVTETSSQIDNRLKHEFPLYKIARVLGFSAVAKERVNSEV